MLRIAPQDIESRLSKDNPWWHAGSKYHSQFKNSVRRDYFKPFFELATDFELKRASILLGPRRVGKTVILFQMIDELLASGEEPENILYVSIDSPVYAGIPLENFLTYIVDRSKGEHARFFVLFDEIQYLKDWEIHLKDLVDRYPTVKFIASGSAAAALQLKSQESGAGRFSDSLLPPLTFLEFVRFLKREDLIDFIDIGIYGCEDVEGLNALFIEYLNFGGFPELALSKRIRSSTDQFIKNDIIDKVLLKDLPNLYGIQNIGELNKLFSFLAYNTGQEASLEAISQNSGLSKGAITNYISYLNSAFLISTLPKLPSSSKGILRQRNFKVYLTNPSMRSALFGEVSAENSELIGHLAEAAILSQLDHISRINSYHYFRDKHGNEVDLVRTDPGTFYPAHLTEVKWSDRISSASHSDLRSVLNFAKKSSLPRVTVTSRTKNEIFDVDGIRVTQIPTSLYCLNLGFLASKAAIDISWKLVQGG